VKTAMESSGKPFSADDDVSALSITHHHVALPGTKLHDMCLNLLDMLEARLEFHVMSSRSSCAMVASAETRWDGRANRSHADAWCQYRIIRHNTTYAAWIERPRRKVFDLMMFPTTQSWNQHVLF
jgi:hypothetical protein